MLSYTPLGLCQWHGRYRCKLRQLKCQGGGGRPAEELSTSWEGSFWREHPLNTSYREGIGRFVQLLFSSHQTNWERTKDKMRISMALVECVDPASKKLFLTRVSFGDDRSAVGGWSHALWLSVWMKWWDYCTWEGYRAVKTLQWEHAKSLLSMHCNVSMGIERKFFLDAYQYMSLFYFCYFAGLQYIATKQNGEKNSRIMQLSCNSMMSCLRENAPNRLVI